MLPKTNAGVFAIGIILVVVVTCAHSQQEIYKWVDEDGNVHYGDTQPEGVESEQVHVNTSPPSDGYVPAPRAPSRQPLVEETDPELDAQQSERNHRLEVEQHCSEARVELAVLQEQMPVYRTEKGELRAAWIGDSYQGERDYLDDVTRELVFDQTIQRLVKNCESPTDVEELNRSRSQWVRSEQCAAARVDLDGLSQPEAKSPRQAIEDMRRSIDEYCND